MVAQTIALPNIRKFFVPDKGYLLVDADLAGADAQVVAWEANDEDLKTAFRAGLKIHIKNVRDLQPDETKHLSDAQLKATDRAGGLYHRGKQRVHATNYGGHPRTLAVRFRTTIALEEHFQSVWFSLHPGILEWHERTEDELSKTRTIYNKFGYRIIYLDRIDGLLPKALAWKPQSTVAITCLKGMVQVEKSFPFVQMLLQTHDSATFQIPIHREDKLPQIVKQFEVEIPYDDPLVIPWNVTTSTESWGDCA